ncbi:MAG: GNAT family N-acetyltransferase [Lachnospiraceae bacterium]|nr:GNAT family N-acetyltransferase [Lachnospiraceae bacterium]
MSSTDLNKRFEFRDILAVEADQASIIEQICFPPEEACTDAMMRERTIKVPDLFLVAVDRESGKIAGFLNGIATNEDSFRDEFFADAQLHDPNGSYVMLLGLDVLPEYRGKGLAREIVSRYLKREHERGRKEVILTCLDAKVAMYQKMGFCDNGIANSSWGGEQWHEMRYAFHI